MDNIQKHFAKTVDDYDTIADKVVFKNNDLHKVLVNAVSRGRKESLKILDLGCGTGHGMKMLAQKFPNTLITGVDYSPKMVKKAEEELAQFGHRIKLLKKNFNEIEFDNDYDVILSAITIHNSTDPEKKKLFKKVFQSLKKGGCFINADFYKHELAEVNKKIQEIYRRFLTKNLSGHELEVWLEHAFSEDMPMKLSEQFETLKSIGFKKHDLLWLYNNEAIYLAEK